jgi:hypothetical protein
VIGIGPGNRHNHHLLVVHKHPVVIVLWEKWVVGAEVRHGHSVILLSAGEAVIGVIVHDDASVVVAVIPGHSHHRCPGVVVVHDHVHHHHIGPLVTVIGIHLVHDHHRPSHVVSFRRTVPPVPAGRRSAFHSGHGMHHVHPGNPQTSRTQIREDFVQPIRSIIENRRHESNEVMIETW